MRLFIALDIPQEIKDLLPDLRDDSLPGARWTSHHQWHITLHFIGDQQTDEEIDHALKMVSQSSFELGFKGLGTFPEKGKPRVLWLGIHAPPSLQQLHSAIGDALRSTGFTPEKRPYHPHLTLARFKQKAPNKAEMDRYLEHHTQIEVAPFVIQHFTLYESKLERSGARYTARKRYPLA